MSAQKDGLPAPPDSPAYASTSAYTPAALRTDHSAIPVNLSTTPIISPPPSPEADRKTQFPSSGSEKYGGHGAQGYGSSASEGDSLLRRTGFDDEERKGKRATSPLDTLVTLLLGMFGILFFIVLLVRLSFIPQHHAAKVASFMPSPVRSFLATVEGPSAPHPIVPLLTEARDKWDKKVSSQSLTFDRATRTYKARYGIVPPPGFDKWFAFATQGRNHSLVDEYDQLMEDLQPFRSLTPQEIRRRTAELAQVPGISIVSIRSGVAQVHSKSGKWAPAHAFQQMIGAFVRDLPDMDIAINEKPEGRVLPRRQKKVYQSDYGLEGDEPPINMTDPMIKPIIKNFTPEWKRDGSVWEAYRRSCPTDSAARRLIETVRSAESNGALVVQGRVTSKLEAPQTRRVKSKTVLPSTREMTFSHALDADFYVCDYPSLHTLHSAFYSDQRSLEYLYPVFSPSKPTGFADILIPSHHYWSPSSEFTYEAEFRRGLTKNPTDIDWALKKHTTYWRGKVTRGADTPPGHGSSFQKQRLVKMANQEAMATNRVLVGFEPKTASITALSVPIAIANKATSDVAMACDPSLGECSYLRSLGYRVEPPAPMSEAWKHKFVLDIDEIGFSPRFPALMESKSAVVKSSIQREFWRGWAQPWKHYIPLSSSYSELHNIQTFFEGYPTSLVGKRGNHSAIAPTVLTRPSPLPELPLNADGTPFDTDKALKEIAEAGAAWKQRHLRKEDMEAYVFRLCLEYARLVTANENSDAEA
ncbi:capsular associated protein [Rhodotorula toruloides]|uniref:Capsular associated protein n=1 Tax=Rhodotorula toruloides TaxID=5286 RepID=A0A511KHM2_RHOTO|nr:capsular associated protein [Rhodotorula toruloides]